MQASEWVSKGRDHDRYLHALWSTNVEPTRGAGGPLKNSIRGGGSEVGDFQVGVSGFKDEIEQVNHVVHFT